MQLLPVGGAADNMLANSLHAISRLLPNVTHRVSNDSLKLALSFDWLTDLTCLKGGKGLG